MWGDTEKGDIILLETLGLLISHLLNVRNTAI